MCVGFVMPVAAHGATYSARIRFQPSDAPDVAGYNVYVRSGGEPYGVPQDAGLPVPAPDGLLAVIVSELDVRTAYVLAASAYTGSGGESDLSNELNIGYADVAPFVDSDDDGLVDAAEDVNLNQIVDPGETDPENPDTDADGILDGSDQCQHTPAGFSIDMQGCALCTELRVQKLRLRARSTRGRLVGRAVSVPAPELDPTVSGVVLEIVGATGASLYRAELPAAAFTTNPARRVFKFRAGPGFEAPVTTNGLTKLVLKRRGTRMAIVAKAASSDLSALLGQTSLTMAVWGGDTCARTRGLTCTRGSGQRMRCR
jgi:hypothetical protein